MAKNQSNVRFQGIPASAESGGYSEILTAHTIEGAGKNFKPLMMVEYYRTLATVNAEMLRVSGPYQVRWLTRWLMSYVTDVDKYMELEVLWDNVYNRLVGNLVEHKRTVGDSPDLTENDLKDTEKLDCLVNASGTVLYEVQRFMNSALGLVKERAVGIAGLFMQSGRHFFPITMIPEDGIYKKEDTGRIVEFNVRSTIMRTRLNRIEDDEQEDDLKDYETEEELSRLEEKIKGKLTALDRAKLLAREMDERQAKEGKADNQTLSAIDAADTAAEKMTSAADKVAGLYYDDPKAAAFLNVRADPGKGRDGLDKDEVVGDQPSAKEETERADKDKDSEGVA